jgi:hypothetical protein
MKSLLVALALTLSAAAMADGFYCEQPDYAMNLKVFNQTSAVRSGAVMVLSDAYVAQGRKTIASFTSTKETLANYAMTYVAAVDLRVSGSNRPGENVLGTKLGYVKYFVVKINHRYRRPVSSGSVTDGTITVVKRDGSTTTLDLICSRYLKNN